VANGYGVRRGCRWIRGDGESGGLVGARANPRARRSEPVERMMASARQRRNDDVPGAVSLTLSVVGSPTLVNDLDHAKEWWSGLAAVWFAFRPLQSRHASELTPPHPAYRGTAPASGRNARTTSHNGVKGRP